MTRFGHGPAIHRLSAVFDVVRRHLPISNAHVERLIRTVAVFRKNCLFVGSLEAGKRYAVLLSLMLECTLAGVNPFDYLVDVFDKIAAPCLASRAHELLPRGWHAARQAEAAEQQ
ncbi:IS66 family transposase [Haliangium ochraceum]|uniref:IS66 family transposase n=1 Tax=Haliangium ochraceum TaxID=80816 RepID=UPI00019B9463